VEAYTATSAPPAPTSRATSCGAPSRAPGSSAHTSDPDLAKPRVAGQGHEESQAGHLRWTPASKGRWNLARSVATRLAAEPALINPWLIRQGQAARS
jgi:hypothetical protein